MSSGKSNGNSAIIVIYITFYRIVMKINKYWFIPKSYGYGYYPITWEGWICVLIILAILALSAYTNSFFEITGPTTKEGFRFVLDLTIFLFVANPILQNKTEEKVTWKWGRR